MKAAIFSGKESIAVKDVPVPEIGADEILVRVKAVGVCPTDVKAYYYGSSSISVPRILGHEVSGIVEKSNNDLFKPGDRVNVAADNPCMKCDRCARGLHNMCRNICSLGVNIDGGYAEFLKVPAEFIGNGMVIKLGDKVSFQEGTFIEPVAVSLNALSLAAPIGSGSAVIIGDGPNAMIHLQLLKRYYKVAKVTVTGMVPWRLNLAQRLGADQTINIVENPESVASLGKDVDIVDITIGNSKALEQAMLLSDAGTRIVIFGGSVNDTQIPITMNKVHYNQITITGSTGTNINHYIESSKIVNSGLIDLNSLVSKQFNLEQITEAFSYSREMKGIKGAIIF